MAALAAAALGACGWHRDHLTTPDGRSLPRPCEVLTADVARSALGADAKLTVDDPHKCAYEYAEGISFIDLTITANDAAAAFQARRTEKRRYGGGIDLTDLGDEAYLDPSGWLDLFARKGSVMAEIYATGPDRERLARDVVTAYLARV